MAYKGVASNMALEEDLDVGVVGSSLVCGRIASESAWSPHSLLQAFHISLSSLSTLVIGFRVHPAAV
jgi:hypothetical protein